MKLRERFKKLRFAFIYPVGIFAVLFFNSSDSSLSWGILFIIAGFFIRIWANGYAVKMDKLTTSGPYAFVRHPLYIGTILLAAGFSIMLNSSYAGILFVAILAIIYYNTIKREENMLEKKFNGAYLEYKRHVPSIFPRLTPFRKGEKWGFSIKRLVRSKEHKAVLWVIILITLIHLKEEIMVEREPFDRQIWHLIIIVTVFWVIDLVDGFVRHLYE